eukprot:6798856-Prorocentrum_lima.AAC.1
MTSSLVGSEMCIRDRLKERLTYELSEPCLTNPGRLGDVASFAIIMLGEAVSYTHLTLPTICSV